MSGEKVEINNEPLELTYDDLMNVDLRLVPATDTYKYNEKYEVYEDMSSDKDYMRGIYDGAEKLKIVGVAVMNSEMLSAGSGVAYLPSLVTHIIEKSGKTEIVQKQLANPEIDVFSNKKFSDEDNDFDFEFSDLVSIDENALAQAFGTTIDQNAISATVAEYIQQIANDITADVSPVRNALTDKFKTLATSLKNELTLGGGYMEADTETIVSDFISRQDFSDLESNYYIPSANAAQFYQELLLNIVQTYNTTYESSIPGFDPTVNKIQIMDLIWTSIVEGFLQTASSVVAFDAVAVPVTQGLVQKEVLTKVSGLAS